MTRVLLIADVHANAPALDSALGEASRLGFDELFCLGDIVGYNASPRECVQRLRDLATISVVGNHEKVLFRDEEVLGTRPSASHVLRWTRGQLSVDEAEWLRDLPGSVSRQGILAAHGCFLNESFYYGYVTDTMLPENLERIALNKDWPQIGVCGHTHSPMCAWRDADGAVVNVTIEPDATIQLPRSSPAIVINPGSVGQPRDGDPRTSFAILDTEEHSVRFVRVPYDIEAAVKAVADAGFPAALGERLWEGR